MSLTIANLRRGGQIKPPIAVIYGKPGIGKTTFAACAPGVVFCQTEDGLTNPALAWVPTFGVVTSYEQVLDVFAIVAQHYEREGWQTLVIDSIDRLIPLMTTYVCQQNGWTKLEDGAYGRGKVAFLEEIRRFMDCLIELRNTFNVGVVLLGHHKAVKITPPDADPYTQYSLAVHEDVSRILIGDSDMVLFATHPVTTTSVDTGFKKKFTRATMDKPRVYTRDRGSHTAKNRYDMAEFMPFEWNAVAVKVPAWNGTQPPQQLCEYIAGNPAPSIAYDEQPVEVAETVGEMAGS